MNITKAQIVELLRSRGSNNQAEQAESDLPDTMDTDRDAGLFDRFGLDVGDLIKRFGAGGLGDLLK